MWRKKWWEGRFLLLLHLLLPVPTLLFLSSGAGRGLSGTVAATLSREQRRGGGRGGDEKEEEKGKWRRRRRRRRMLWPRWGWEAARPARHPRAGYCNWQEDTSHPLQSWKNALDADFKVCRKNMLYFDIWWQKRHNTPVSQKKCQRIQKCRAMQTLTDSRRWLPILNPRPYGKFCQHLQTVLVGRCFVLLWGGGGAIWSMREHSGGKRGVYARICQASSSFCEVVGIYLLI